MERTEKTYVFPVIADFFTGTLDYMRIFTARVFPMYTTPRITRTEIKVDNTVIYQWPTVEQTPQQ